MKFPQLRIGNLSPRLPIIQGGMGALVSLHRLASAVANEGGIGIISSVWLHAKNRKQKKRYTVQGKKIEKGYLDAIDLRQEIKKARKLTDGIIGVNILYALTDFYDLAMTAIDEYTDLIITGAGFSREIYSIGKRFDTPIIPVVSSARLARIAQPLGASAIVAEGYESGGHMGTERSTWDILPEIIKAVSLPVIAAGGIYDGYDVVKALKAGACGVQMGTRFGATEECDASIEFKKAWLKADKKDITIIKSPVGMRSRVIKNEFAKKVERGETQKVYCPVQCLKTCEMSKAPYCIVEVLLNAARGIKMDNAMILCGENVYKVKEILTVKQVFDELTQTVERHR
ncbi:nitronate monooxygenase [candidate division WOR-3 bacterium]|nr:nitronate monooxygenase [candidate division WOR-3 bacterium]